MQLEISNGFLLHVDARELGYLRAACEAAESAGLDDGAVTQELREQLLANGLVQEGPVLRHQAWVDEFAPL